MSDVVVRIVIVAAIGLVTVAASLASRRLQKPAHPPLDMEGLGLPAGIVLFTSGECDNCKEALAVAAGTGAPLREVTWELEPEIFERAGVQGVPLTVILNGNGAATEMLAGVPGSRRLQRALRTSGF